MKSRRKRSRNQWCGLVAVLLVTYAHHSYADTTSAFYPLCVEMGVAGVNPRPLSEQATMFHDLGFDGIGTAFWPDEEFEANLKLLDDAHLQLFMLWTQVNVNPANGPAFDARLPQSIRRLRGRPTTICVLLQGLKPADPQGMAPAIKALRELADVAAEAGVRISIYHHVNDWTEGLPFAIDVVQRVNHPQVGFNFNLCHWLKVEGTKDYRPLLREHAARLYCVTINGATISAADWTNGLIQPLDQGDFDNRQLLQTLAEIGYTGPVGLQCYGIPGDPRDYLARSVKVWRELQASQPVVPTGTRP